MHQENRLHNQPDARQDISLLCGLWTGRSLWQRDSGHFQKAFPFLVFPKPKPRAEMNSSENRDGKDSQAATASLKPGRVEGRC